MPGNLPGNFAINKDENRKSSFMKVEALNNQFILKIHSPANSANKNLLFCSTV